MLAGLVPVLPDAPHTLPFIAYFGDHRPASTLVEVSALVDPRLKVEIECQAYLPDAAG
jgi:enamine deaminase RidA (YjgF/YER057c/UK114 family)